MVDVVRGSLGTLQSTKGNYTAAVNVCLANDVTALSVADPNDPPVGGVFWLLLRANFPGGPGTYDETGPGQMGSRDAEIAAAPAACP